MRPEDMMSKFPVGSQLDDLLRLSFPADVKDLLANSLIRPIEDLYGRPGKKFRNQIVEVGYLLAGSEGTNESLSQEETAILEGCSKVLEAIHAGSLVVDDIQDGSKVRRGEPALHLRYGLPVALNAGNWLYFWPMRVIRGLKLDQQKELMLYQLCHDTLLRAHFGQAIDVGVPIDSLPQERVHSVCMASLELKSGALMALAMTLGAAAGGATQERIEALEKFGHQFGVALQMFDDIGNLKAKPEAYYDYTKRYEDLLLKRPSWIWAVVSKFYPEKAYQDFVNAANHLPDESFLVPWLELHELASVAKKEAWEYLTQATQTLENSLGKTPREQKAIEGLKQLCERLAKSYD